MPPAWAVAARAAAPRSEPGAISVAFRGQSHSVRVIAAPASAASGRAHPPSLPSAARRRKRRRKPGLDGYFREPKSPVNVAPAPPPPLGAPIATPIPRSR